MRVLFTTERTRVFRLHKRHAAALQQYYASNAEHLAPWVPTMPGDPQQPVNWSDRVEAMDSEQKAGQSLRLLAFLPESDEVVGICSFTNIVHGVFKACYLGYSVSESFEGQGLMTEILGASVHHVFETYDLHRIMANYVPDNVKSQRVLEKLGFEKEGLAKSYLFIAGQWRDHVLTSKLNPNHL